MSTPYLEAYLQLLHEDGYPTEDQRKDFNTRFYDSQDLKGGSREVIRKAVSKIHGSFKNNKMPAWVSGNPVHEVRFVEVLADFNTKYDTNNDTFASVESGDEGVTLPIKAEESMDELNVSGPRPRDADDTIASVFSDNESKTLPIKREHLDKSLSIKREQSEKNLPIKREHSEKTETDEKLLKEKKKHDEDLKKAKTRITTLEKEKAQVLQKNEKLEAKVKQMEKEAAEKDSTIQKLKKRSHPATNEPQDKGLKAAKDQLERMAEKMEFLVEKLEMKEATIRDKDSLIGEKERAILLLASGKKAP